MKKLLLVLSLLLFILSSCSSSSSGESQNETVQGPLISKMVYKGESVALDYKDYDFNFIYDSNQRLIRINRGDKVYREYTYSNDLIIEAKYYVFWNGNSESELEDIFHFDYDSSNRLIKATTSSFEYIFTYTDSSHADYIMHIYSWSGDNHLYRTGAINFDSVTKNILSITNQNYAPYLGQNGLPQPSSPMYKQELFYDTMKHPCSNIKGYKELAFFNLMNMDVTIFTPNFGVNNNLKEVNSYPIDQPSNNTSPVWSYEYGQTFPLKAKKLSSTDFNLVFYF